MVANVNRLGLKILVSAVRFRPRPPVKSRIGIRNPAIFLVVGFFVVLSDVTADVRRFLKSTGFLTVLAQVVVVGTMPCAFAVKSKGGVLPDAPRQPGQAHPLGFQIWLGLARTRVLLKEPSRLGAVQPQQRGGPPKVGRAHFAACLFPVALHTANSRVVAGRGVTGSAPIARIAPGRASRAHTGRIASPYTSPCAVAKASCVTLGESWQCP